MDDQTQISRLLQPYLQDDRLYIVDSQVAGRQGGRIKVTILLDSDTGITIEECALISRRLGAEMDEMNYFGDAPFILEVSSPGVDHPLLFPRRYVRNIGRQLVVTLTDGRVLKGQLISVADDQIVLQVEPEKKSASKKKKEAGLVTDPATITPTAVGPTPIGFDQITKANVEISFK